MRLLTEIYYNKKVYLLIDEYDTPFIAANSGGYYGQVRGILAGMLSSALKGSRSLEKAVLTGIQRVAKENIFSGLNNLIVCTIADPDYDDCFGFTEDEVKELLAYCGIGFTAAVREMYDGYRIGKADVYNPWSVLQSYWVNTSENSILKDALGERGRSFAEDYDRLIGQGAVEAEVELSAAYYEKPGDAALWGLLINAGMLTITEKTDENRYRLRVPNQEVWKPPGAEPGGVESVQGIDLILSAGRRRTDQQDAVSPAERRDGRFRRGLPADPAEASLVS